VLTGAVIEANWRYILIKTRQNSQMLHAHAHVCVHGISLILYVLGSLITMDRSLKLNYTYRKIFHYTSHLDTHINSLLVGRCVQILFVVLEDPALHSPLPYPLL